MERARAYWFHAYALVFTPALLLADSRVANVWQQSGLGVLTFAVLFLGSRRIEPRLRRQLWLCVIVATGYEVIGSLIWGIYRYRFHNLPLYVPPGHGLVYLFGLTAAATPILQRRGREAAWIVFGLATLWAVAGVTVLPRVTGRTDIGGAMLLPLFALFVLRTPRAGLFVGIFIATAELEIFGTGFGTWTWAAFQPNTHIAQGNPPSVIAGGYCVIDGTVILVALGIDRLLAHFRPAAAQPASVPVAAPLPAATAAD